MKKIIYLLSAAALFTVTMQAQNAIPNGNFESWTTGTFDTPVGYWNSNPSTFFKCNSAFNCIKTTDSQHGVYAIQLTTNVGTDTCMGYVVNSPNPNGNNPCLWPGGSAYNQIPTGIQGFYKSNEQVGDSGGILVGFKNGGTCLGLYMHKFGGVHNTYTAFNFTFNPPISGTPDTVVFAAVSSDVFNKVQKNGSMLQLDNISFVGASQPATFNGDFENWQSQTANKPNNWYLQTNDQGSGILQTTDKKAGTYAMEMKTFLGSRGNNNTPAASGAGVSTGYYPNHCGGSCPQRGGHPFTNQIDTLMFYYKYAPSGNDTAQVGLNFKKNGVNVWGTGMWYNTPQSTYQFAKIPFNTGTPIDSVIVSFQSSSWRDSSLTFIGSDFKVDEAHFASQPLNTGIKTFDASIGIKVFPNPSADGNFVVSNIQTYDLVRVYNVFGQEVNAGITKENDYAKVQINTAGVYFIYVNAQGKITNQKVIVTKD
ncbi:MAG TPA: T9SS type A sorting domain-containing protein [Bacteroidia bacterium]|jgi:hypothetical protein|nr:T9SS type A sorting domain-containing protein [Bacteroidia bacterium]